MVVCAVQGGHGPDVGVVGEGCAVDALQLQQQVVGAGVPVAHGGAVFKQAVCNMAQGAVPGGVIIDAVVADPGEVDLGLLIVGHGGGDLSALPQGIMDGNGRLHGRVAVSQDLISRAGGGEGEGDGPVRRIGAVDRVVALLTIGFHSCQGCLHHPSGGGYGETGVLQDQRVLVGCQHVADAFIYLRRSGGSGDIRPQGHQISHGSALGAPGLLSQVPVRRCP